MVWKEIREMTGDDLPKEGIAASGKPSIPSEVYRL
jgi:hypothetical protein